MILHKTLRLFGTTVRTESIFFINISYSSLILICIILILVYLIIFSYDCSLARLYMFSSNILRKITDILEKYFYLIIFFASYLLLQVYGVMNTNNFIIF